MQMHDCRREDMQRYRVWCIAVSQKKTHEEKKAERWVEVTAGRETARKPAAIETQIAGVTEGGEKGEP